MSLCHAGNTIPAVTRRDGDPPSFNLSGSHKLFKQGRQDSAWSIRPPATTRSSSCASWKPSRTACRSTDRVCARALSLASPEVEVALVSTDLVARPGTKETQFVSYEDGIFTVSGRLELAAPAQLVYDTLADYESCAKVFHNITDSVVQPLPGHDLMVLQKCRWSFLAFSGSFDCSFVVQQDDQEYRLSFKLLKSSFMRDFKGRWHVKPATLAGEAGDPSSVHAAPACVVEHLLSVKPMMDMPAPIATYTRGIFVQQVSSILDDLAAEIQRKVAASRS